MISIMGNKLAQYLLFAEFMPATYVCNNIDDLYHNLDKFRCSKIVIKPTHGYGGSGVLFIDKEDLSSRIKKIKLPCLIQEFVKSNGIPGLEYKERPMDLK